MIRKATAAALIALAFTGVGVTAANAATPIATPCSFNPHAIKPIHCNGK